MKASVITIGDEILIGQVVDTNSAWIAARLSEAGFVIVKKLTVGDIGGEIRDALDEALGVSDLVVVTGGLGPTRDDITKHTLAEYFGMGLREDDGVLGHVREILSRRGIEVNGLNRAQALVPDGCTVLPNENGTAPGMWFERDSAVVVSLPGVPFEMKELMERQVMPRLGRFAGGLGAVHRTVHTAGIAESVLAERIAPWEASLSEGIKLAYLPSTAGVRLRLSYTGSDTAGAGEAIETYIGQLKDIIGAYLLPEGEDDPARAVARLLREAGKTLALAESCTGGRISNMFTLREGASDFLLGGVVAYSADVKRKVLGVAAATIDEHGVVSRQTALAMAEGVRSLTGADYAISTTGIAGPGKGGTDEPVGTVWIGIAHPEGSYARKVRFGMLREPNIERASHTAVNLLRLHLEGDGDAPVAGGIF